MFTVYESIFTPKIHTHFLSLFFMSELIKEEATTTKKEKKK